MSNGYVARQPRTVRNEKFDQETRVALLEEDMDTVERRTLQEIQNLKRVCYGAIGTFGSAALLLGGNLLKAML